MNLENYKFKTELHSHSNPVSYCSKVSPEKLAELYKKAGADAVVLTNHFAYWHFEEGTKEQCVEKWLNDYIQLKKYGEAVGLSIILGMEIRFPDCLNDYLVYGIDENDVFRAADYLDKDIETFYREFKNERNVIIQAHPMRINVTPVGSEVIDGVELFNMHHEYDPQIFATTKHAKENNFLITGGTDFHQDDFAGACLIKTTTLPKDSFEVAEIIKKQDFILDICGNTVIPFNFSQGE